MDDGGHFHLRMQRIHLIRGRAQALLTKRSGASGSAQHEATVFSARVKEAEAI